MSTTTPPHILLVEDEKIVRRSIALTLAKAGYQVSEAEGASEALDRLAREPIALVITDVWMPDQTGLDFLLAARTNGAHHPFVFISGGSPNEPLERTIGKAQAHGAVSFLMKPFDDEELLDAVRAASA